MASVENVGRAMSEWSAKEIDYLRENYGFGKAVSIAQVFNRNLKSVQAKASRIGISNTPQAWTRKEEELLREVYPVNRIDETVKLLGRKRGSVVSRARILGLKINFEAVNYGS